jgi:localization factor PodJL
MGGAARHGREPAGYDAYAPGPIREDVDPIDRILSSLDKLGERIRTLSPAEPRRAPPRAAEADDLQRAIEQISRKRESSAPVRPFQRETSDVAELGARVRALSADMHSDRRRPAPPAAHDGLSHEVADLRAEVERLVETTSSRSLENAFDTLVTRLDDIRLAVDNPRVVGDLVQRLAEVRRLIGSLPSGDQVGVITDRLDRLAERLDQGLGDQRVLTDFGRSLSDLAAAVAQLDKREVIAAIEHRLDDVAASIRAIERDVGNFSRWQDSLERQTTTLSQVAQRSEQLPRFAHELERQSASIERIARSTEGLPRIAEDIDGLRLSLDKPGVSLDADAIRALDERFAALGRSLEEHLKPPTGIPDELLTALSRIEAKLAEPADRRLSDIEDQISVLTRSVADIDFATSKDVGAIEQAITQLRSDVVAAAGRPDAGFAADIRMLVERIERLDPPSIDSRAFDRLEARMTEIVSRLETRPNEISALAEALERLDATMANSLSVDAIADRVARVAGRDGDALPRLAAVEANINRLGDDLRAEVERDRSLLIAIGETIERLAQRAGGMSPSSVDDGPDAPRDTWREIGEKLTASVNRRPPAADLDETDDLPRIFGRKAAQPARVEPSLGKPVAEAPVPPDFDVNKPLEPGSGKPRPPKAAKSEPVTEAKAEPKATPTADPARKPSKADFIAAARRAAQAAGSAQAPAEPVKHAEAASGGPRRRVLPKLNVNLRKVAMAGAVVLIALGLVKIANDQLHRLSARPDTTAEVESPAPTPSVAPAAPAESAVPQSAAPSEVPKSEAPTSEAVPPPTAPAAQDNPLGPQSMAPASSFTQSAPALPTNSFEPVATASASLPAPTAEAPVSETVAPPVQMAAGPAPKLPEAIGTQALRDAATAGDSLAAFEVGSRFADGQGVPQDLASAIVWYKRAAEAGLAPAQYRLGSLYEKGQGTPRDAKAAAEWYGKAAALGNAKAMHNLAVINAEGSLGSPDYALAAKWFQEASERGVRDSQFNLGILYARGLGVARDLAASYKWFALAATAGDADAAKKRDDIAQVLSKDDLARARLAVETWVAKPLDPKAEDVPPINPAWTAAPGHTASVDDSRIVARTQAILSSLGFNAGAPDGKMGKQTRDAISAFQASRGMPTTGEIDKALIEALGMRSI